MHYPDSEPVSLCSYSLKVRAHDAEWHWTLIFFLRFLTKRVRQRTVLVANIWTHVTKWTRIKSEVVSVFSTIFTQYPNLCFFLYIYSSPNYFKNAYTNSQKDQTSQKSVMSQVFLEIYRLFRSFDLFFLWHTMKLRTEIKYNINL